MLNRLVAAFIPTGTPLIVLRGPLAGAWWITGAASGAGKGLSVVLGRVEAAQMRIAAQLASQARVAFDIGANVGLYTLLFARRAPRVVAFEPLPRNIGYLERLVRLNHLENVVVVPWAVTERSGVGSFVRAGDSSLGHLAENGEQPVALTSCDEFVDRFGLTPDLIKVDVEGEEAAVLRGARQTLAKRPVILLSTHGPAARAESLAYLRTVGYAHIEPIDAAEESHAAEFLVR
jgi:FkbM family methyltransferase